MPSGKVASLNFMDHFGNAIHHLILETTVAPSRWVGNRFAVARALDHKIRYQGDSLRVVQLHAAFDRLRATITAV